MGKRTSTKDAEALLGELVTKVSPAEVRIMVPRFAVLREKARFEISTQTRGSNIGWIGSTIAEAADDALGYLEEPPPTDPFVPAWRRCNRLQREYVRELLNGMAATQTTKAIAARMKGVHTEAQVAFDLADALHAAVAEIDFEVTDEDGVQMEEETLDAGEDESPFRTPIAARTKPTTK